MMTRRLVVVVLVAMGCGQAQAPAPCGEGTVERSGLCVGAALVRCGAGTELQGDSCLALPSPNGLRCGANTTLQGSTCEGVGGVTCGAGTVESGGRCLPSGAALSCGENTQASNGQCVPSLSAICGAGTSPSAAQCVATAGGGSPTLTAFAANLALHGAHDGPSSTRYGSSRKTIITTFAQSQAEAWALSGAEPVGAGSAIQIGVNYGASRYGIPSPGDFVTVAIFADTSSATCPASLPVLAPYSSDKARVTFVERSAGTATLKACAKGGSVRYERLSTGEVKVTLNVEFNDGTLWQDKSFTVSSVSGY